MDARLVYPREEVRADFRRYVESPSVVGYLRGVEDGLQTAVFRSRFHAEVRLEQASLVECISARYPERHLEQRVLLVGVDNAVAR